MEVIWPIYPPRKQETSWKWKIIVFKVGMQKLIVTASLMGGVGGDSQTHRQHADRICLLSFFQNEECGLNGFLRQENTLQFHYKGKGLKLF
jgi:hypothetical protein